MAESKTYWTWKGALASGKLRSFTSRDAKDDGYVWEPYSLHKVGRDAFETRGEARATALIERDRKVSSLKKQIAKLKRMTFEGDANG